MSSVLDVLLSGARNVNREVPEKDFEVIRLSREIGSPVVFRIRALPYDRCAEIGNNPHGADATTVLHGVIQPDFKDPALARQLGLLADGETWGDHGVTPMDAVKALLLPGEIGALFNAIQQLSGYGRVTIREIKKN